VDPQFKLVYISVLGLTVLVFVAAFLIVVFSGSPMNEQQRAFFTMCTHGFGVGFGFLAGGYASQRSGARVRTAPGT
jgi:hypothetical protein